jgi:hypothetical protein
VANIDFDIIISEFGDHFKCSSCGSECGFNFVAGMEEDIGLHIQNDEPCIEQVRTNFVQYCHIIF